MVQLLIIQRVAIANNNDENIPVLGIGAFPVSFFLMTAGWDRQRNRLYTSDLKLVINVIHGGFLLHHVNLSTSSTFSVVLNQ